jgi:hypothetical protein
MRMISDLIFNLFDLLLLIISVLTVGILGFANLLLSIIYNITIAILDITSTILTRLNKVLE